MTDGKNEDNVKQLNATPKSTGTTIVSLPVFSTKVLAGLETDETLARVKSVQRKKRRARYRKKPLK